jgi:hypothetical protein
MPITNLTPFSTLKRGEVFIETGCAGGDGIRAALGVGFKSVISIELDHVCVELARVRFAAAPVTILHGDSVRILPQVLAELEEPATIWLDAHPKGGSPVLVELRLLAMSHIRCHTILIDDRRLMHGEWRDVTEGAVRQALLEVNPQYTISTVGGYIPDDIIVAQAL